CQQLNSYSLF
nr:immunoglobulin light chain junction region [Homo sapiens]